MVSRHIRTAVRHFIADLPLLAAIWAVATLGVAAVSSVGGDVPLTESLALATTFLPLAIPLSPLLWLRRLSPIPDRTLPTVGVGCAWFIVTMPLAVGASVALANLLGLD